MFGIATSCLRIFVERVEKNKIFTKTVSNMIDRMMTCLVECSMC